ncbi:MAG: hypothetical protein A2Y94_06030 [Caldithrix sp. RBG_13_44_9]|nr:MAG: hypothetical protein A2Y94_06030 [Caldithrix sp. RBG_13_44_9]
MTGDQDCTLPEVMNIIKRIWIYRFSCKNEAFQFGKFNEKNYSLKIKYEQNIIGRYRNHKEGISLV